MKTRNIKDNTDNVTDTSHFLVFLLFELQVLAVFASSPAPGQLKRVYRIHQKLSSFLQSIIIISEG